MYRNAVPIQAPDAFDDDSENAQLSQAGFLLGTSLVVAGDADRVPEGEFLGVDRMALAGKGTSGYQAVVQDVLQVDSAVIEGDRKPDLIRTRGRELALQTMRDAEPDTALALMIAATHSDHELVRVSAAAAASIATDRGDLFAGILIEGLESLDDLVVDLSATALARIDPENQLLAALVEEDNDDGEQQPPTNTAFITHGTWARRQGWWKPGGRFFEYIDAEPKFNLHQRPFEWTGSPWASKREVAAVQMIEWIGLQGLDMPDVIGHSHGSTVANLASQNGQDFDRMILLSWPVHEEWFPDFDRVARIYSFRVKYDLVIMADRGGQVFRPPSGDAHKVVERVNGYFTHSDPREAEYWNQYQLADLIV